MSWVEEFFDAGYESEYAGLLADTESAAREVDFIQNELELTGSERVLDLACGHGRHAVVLAPRVAEFVGFDRTDLFLQHARKWASEKGITNIQFVRGDMRRLNYEAEFDAAYNYFTAWGYYDDETNLDILRRVCRALKPGGRFLLEMIMRDSLMRRFQPRGWSELDDGTIVFGDRSFDFETGRILDRRTYLKGSEKRTVVIDLRVPAPEELLRLLREAGFDSVRLVQAPEGEKVTLKSRRIAAIGSKK